jgi:hypothetical protein
VNIEERRVIFSGSMRFVVFKSENGEVAMREEDRVAIPTSRKCKAILLSAFLLILAGIGMHPVFGANPCGSRTEQYTPPPVVVEEACSSGSKCVVTRTTSTEYTRCKENTAGYFLGGPGQITVFFEGGGGCKPDGTCKDLSAPVSGLSDVTVCNIDCRLS